MSTKVAQERDVADETVAQRINGFLTRYRIVFISVFGALLLAIIVLLVISVVTEKRNATAFESVETALASWDTARAATDKTGLAAKEDSIIADLGKVAANNGKSYASSRALMTIAEIYYSRKDWKNAGEKYLAAATSAPKAYTSGLNYFNAAVCYDELGNEDDALTYFNKALNQENFNLKARTLFNIGRIEEQRSKKTEALAAYEKMAAQYPDDDWTLLAKSRIIALQIQK